MTLEVLILSRELSSIGINIFKTFLLILQNYIIDSKHNIQFIKEFIKVHANLKRNKIILKIQLKLDNLKKQYK